MIELIFFALILASLFGAITTGVWALVGMYLITYLVIGVVFFTGLCVVNWKAKP